MPFVSRNVEINGKVYLDGGLADSIPILHAVTDGCRKNVVVMTKEEGYRRSPLRHAGAARLKYRDYPKVYELMKNRHNSYNETLDYIDRQVEEGTVFLIQPRHKSSVSRTEKDAEKLRALYEEGYEEAAARKDELNGSVFRGNARKRAESAGFWRTKKWESRGGGGMRG